MSGPLAKKTGPGLALERLDTSCLGAFATLVCLYEQSFPEAERKPVDWLRRMLATENYFLFLATEEGAPVGFAVARLLSGGSTALLEYMAVAHAQRERGLGRQIVLGTAHAVQAPLRTLLLEVESDRVDSPDRVLRTRRKNFYRSLGAREMQGLRWIMPPVTGTPPPAMEMMIFGTENPVPRHQLRTWLTDIYVDVYDQSADDPRIDSMLNSLPDEVRLI